MSRDVEVAILFADVVGSTQLYEKLGDDRARKMVAEKRIEEAKDFVDPLLRRSTLHFSEFRALAEVEMEIALADNQTDAARSWLKMWEQIEPDNPELNEWKVLIDGPGLLKGLQNLLGSSRDQKS